MEIKKINTIFNYETKTQKGNTYRRSNVATAMAVLGVAARNSAGLIWKDNKVIKSLTWNTFLASGAKKVFKSLPKGVENSLIVLDSFIDLVSIIGLGRYLDYRTNKSRAAKADQKAEQANLNA